MNKEQLLQRLKEIQERGKAIQGEMRAEGADVDTLITEVDTLTAEKRKLEAELKVFDFEEGEKRSTPTGQLNTLGTYSVGSVPGASESKEERSALLKKYETRGEDLKSKRSVTFGINEIPELRASTIGGGTLVVENKYSNQLNPRFNDVSSLVDVVNTVPLNGGESYVKGFEISNGEGNYTTEEGNYTDTDPVFGYVTIGKAKITAYAELTDEAMKLTNVDYQSRVADSIGKAIRKKITRQIMVGAGGANALTGVFNAPEAVIPAISDLSLSTIDADTLDKIVLGYGGDEDVESAGYLILNKSDLAAFAAVRSTTGEKLYKIKKNGNVGTISSDDSFEVPFIINSAVAPLSSANTAAGTFTMAYGMVKAYEMPIFSDVTVEESRDFKFKTGQIAYRGSVWVGGNVALYKGFIRVKKAATV